MDDVGTERMGATDGHDARAGNPEGVQPEEACVTVLREHQMELLQRTSFCMNDARAFTALDLYRPLRPYVT